MSREIRINFMDFGRIFNPEKFFLTKLLRKRYQVTISPAPDYVFYTLGGNTHHNFKGIRIFWTGENVAPNFNYCDYALSFQHMIFEDRYFRLPLWRTKSDLVEYLTTSPNPKSGRELVKRKFCCAVISNSTQTDGTRERLFEAVSQYKTIASGGRYKNNVGGRVRDKLEFQRNYKFTLAAENTCANGYTTEKLIQAFASDSIPIYYGDPLAVRDFNPRAFINVHDFASIDDVVKRIKQIDEHENLYDQIISEPTFLQNRVPQSLSDEAILNFLSNIFDQSVSDAKRRYYHKPYVDLNYNEIKARDVKGIIGALIRKHLPFGKCDQSSPYSLRPRK